MNRTGQGEAVASWAIWSLVTLEVLVTYSWVDPAELYHVSVDGLPGGLSRAVTIVNYPMALVAVALVLVAAAALPRRAWWAAAPAFALCGTLPFVLNQDDLDARWVNALPALGVLLAGGLTIAAVRHAGATFAPRRPWDPVRVVIAVVVLLMSLPWLTAELGFHFPGDVFMGEELGREKDGTVIAAVHLGHHHGMDGALLLLTALLLSRVWVERGPMRIAVFAYLGALLTYGSANFVQDAWGEQVVKRGWTDTGIPSVILPGLKPIWLLLIGLAVVAAVVLLKEEKRA